MRKLLSCAICAPLPKNNLESGFEKFWSAYPKKTAKVQALKAWKKLKPDEKLIDKILWSLERQKS